mmetsp:Transcript_99678/g.281376  ORF Transcript_99678/g.281376 Transcript_99678/m.281376 type:complete len:1328 (-) Transcript_99678:146-4129(-)
MADRKRNEITLEVAHAFGSLASGTFRDAACFADDGGRCIVAPVGRHVALRNVETGDATFYFARQHVDGVSAMCISRDRGLMAVCEHRSTAPQVQVSIHDLKSEPDVPPLAVAEPLGRASGRVVAAAWSLETPSKYLCLACAGLETCIVVLDWEAERIVTKLTLQSPVDRVAFAPNDGAVISISGAHQLRLLRLKNATSKHREGSLAMMPGFGGFAEESLRITDHAWTETSDGLLVACVAEGAVYVLDSNELTVVNTLDPAFDEGLGVGILVPLTVRCFSQGFLVGGGEGIVAIWERVDTPPGREDSAARAVEFQHIKTVQVRRTDAGVCSLSMNSSEELVALSFKNGDVGIVPFLALQSSEDDCDCTILNGGFHGGPIVGLDMAVQRPLAVSACRKDSSVRVWNHVTKTCELRWHFAGEAPTAVALHPLGYFLAAALQEKIQFFHILSQELKLYREVAVQSGRLLRFAHGGHVLAVAQGNVVLILGLKSLDRIATLEGHANKVTALCFDPDDSRLLTCAIDGAIVEWNARTWQRQNTFSTASREYVCTSVGPEEEALCSAFYGSKCFLQYLRQGDIAWEKEVPDRVKITALCHHAPSGTWFLGTSAGSIWALCGPELAAGSGPAALKPNAEQGAHSGACSFLSISLDGSTLLSGGDDGAIFVIAVAGITCADSGGDAGALAETVLIDRGEIQQRNEELRLLRAEKSALSMRLVDQTAQLEEECRQRVFEARQKDQADIAELARRCKVLETVTVAKEEEGKRTLASMESSHAEAAEQLERLYNAKLEHEGDRYASLLERQAELVRVTEEVRQAAKLQLDEEAVAFEEDLGRRVAEKELEIQKHRDLIAFSQHRFETILEAEAKQNSKEVAETKVNSFWQLEEQKQIEDKLRREQEVLLKGLEMMEIGRVHMEKEKHETSAAIAGLKSQSEELNRTVSSLTDERKERALTLRDKEAKIQSYKVKVDTLRKFKHVLDEDLREVMESQQPKDAMIAQLKAHLKELENEYERQLDEQRGIEATIDIKKQQIAVLTAEGQDLRAVITDKDRIITRFTDDLTSLVEDNRERKRWPREIRRMHQTYVLGEANREDRLPLEELQQKMRLVEKRVTTLATKCGQTEATCKADMQRKANQGALLIHELNELRVSKQQLKMHVRGLEKKLEDLGRQSLGDADREPPQALQGSASMPRVVDRPRSEGDGSLRQPEVVPQRPPSPTPKTPTGSRPGPRQQSGGGLPRESSLRRRPTLGQHSAAAEVASAVRKAASEDGRPRAGTGVRLVTSPGLELLQKEVEESRHKLDAQNMENEHLREQLDVMRGQKGSFSSGPRRSLP